MRVAILHGSSDLYGASKVLLQDCASLLAEGLQIEVVLPSNGPLAEALMKAGAVVTISKLRVLRRSDRRSLYSPAWKLPPWQRRPDVAVLWTLALVPHLPSLRLNGFRTLISVHELFDGRLAKFLASTARATSGIVQANSEATAAWLQSAGLPANRVSIAFPAAPSWEPLPERPHDGTLRILLAGRVNGHKGHLEAVEVIERLRAHTHLDVRLTLAGEPFRGQEAHLHALLRRIDELPWARYVGQIEGLRHALNDHDCLMFWSQTPESFGLTPMEAWACGRPSFGLGPGGAAEALALVEGHLVSNSSPDEAAREIASLIRAGALDGRTSADAPASQLATQAQRVSSWMSLLLEA